MQSHATGVVVTDADDGDGGIGGWGGVWGEGGLRASIIPCSLIALHQSCPGLTLLSLIAAPWSNASLFL